jgi:hypothetical protein
MLAGGREDIVPLATPGAIRAENNPNIDDLNPMDTGPPVDPLQKRPAGSVLPQRAVPRELSSHFEDPCNIGARFGDSTRPQPARRSSASRANSCASP